MWPFILTRKYVFSKTIPTSKEELMRIVHDPQQSVGLSPLYKTCVQDPKDPAWYTVTERLPVLGGLYESSTTFRCRFENNDEGRYTEVFAGVGTHMDCTVRVEESKESPGSSVFTEIIVLKGFILLMPYIISTMSKAHYAILDALVAKFVPQKSGSFIFIKLPWLIVLEED